MEYFYAVVSQGRVKFAGGAEVQMAHLARGLVHQGFDVSVVTCDFGQPDGLEVDGMRLLRAYPPRAGLPIVRFFHPRLTLGVGAMRRADADVYLCKGASQWAGIVCDVAHSMGRKFVWIASHNHDALRALPDIRSWRAKAFAKHGILRADAIVSQTEAQQRLLRESFRRESTVVPNVVPLPPVAQMVDAAGPPVLVWLATYKPSKRPAWFTRFAERHPAVRCRMAGTIPGPPRTPESWVAARVVAERCPNLEVLPTLPHEQVGEFLRSATLFAHSSAAEGLPNTFLEAWAHGLPCVTSFDPDDAIERERLGACRHDYDAWEAELERRIADPALRAAEGARARAHVEAHHAPSVIHPRFADVLRRTLGQAPVEHSEREGKSRAG
jgi:glycosyltransferase involved in cell wall biosynthesis